MICAACGHEESCNGGCCELAAIRLETIETMHDEFNQRLGAASARLRDQFALAARDQFALAALSGIAEIYFDANDYEKMANHAYLIADAMMRRREVMPAA